jgi:hypothetical protein
MSQLLSDLAFDLASRGQDIHVITGGQLYTDPRASLLSDEMIHGFTYIEYEPRALAALVSGDGCSTI